MTEAHWKLKVIAVLLRQTVMVVPQKHIFVEVLLKFTVMKRLQLMKVVKNVVPASYILVPVVKIVKLY